MEQNNNKSKNEESSVWLGEDGIVQAQIGKKYNEKTVDIVVKKFIEVTRELTTKPKILIDISLTPPAYKIILRKKIVKVLKDLFKDPGFEKLAMWGAKTTFIKAITLFIIRAIGIDNIKYFKTEEEAIKWLKEE